MGAPKTMSNQPKQTGLKRLFGFKKKHHAPLKVNSVLPPSVEKKKKFGFWKKSKTNDPEVSVDASSGSSEGPSGIRPEERIQSIHPAVADSLTQSPKSDKSPRRQIFQAHSESSKIVKVRDGFCRRVDAYDGSVIHVEGAAAYELGNYLGGGVAGVVYQGHRLLHESCYPVRMIKEQPTPAIETPRQLPSSGNILSCVPTCHPNGSTVVSVPTRQVDTIPQNLNDTGSLVTTESFTGRSMAGNSVAQGDATMALEAVNNTIVFDTQDAPSRSKHTLESVLNTSMDENASFAPSLDEHVAIKILNPVGFRTLDVDVTNKAVVARPGEPLERQVLNGKAPMEERHVWWLINPSSRNLRTLQRYAPDGATPRGVEVDRGTAEKGLRISLIAAYKDKDNKIKELPLTRCIDIWGHVPFEAPDSEFKDVMNAIDQVNQGLPPPPIVPGRVGTGTSSVSSGLEDLKLTTSKSNLSRKA